MSPTSSEVPLIEDPAVQDCGHGYSPHEFCPICDLDSDWGDE